MWALLTKSLWLLLFSFVCVAVYSVGLWATGQLLFPFQANGSLLYNADHHPVASALLAQPFSQPGFFHPRPSATHFSATASAASSLAASSGKLRKRVTQTLQDLNTDTPVPADAVMTSASGLDPHISLENALGQVGRISAEWAAVLHQNPVVLKNEITDFVREKAFSPLQGLAGGKIINVIYLNLWIDQHYRSQTHG